MGALKAKRINLYHRMHEDPVRDAVQRRRLHLVLPLLFIMLIVIGIECAFIFVLQPELDTRYAELQSQLDMEEYYRAVSLQSQQQSLAVEYNKLNGIAENFASYPTYTAALHSSYMDEAKAAGVQIQSVVFDRDSGALVLTGIGADAVVAADYAQALRESERYLYVAYYGYSLGSGELADATGAEDAEDAEETQQPAGEAGPGLVYGFTITLYVAAEEG